MTTRLVEVALPLPLLRTFTYAVPERTRHPVHAGSRVVVNVRGKRVIGICIGESDGVQLGGKEAKPLLDVPDSYPTLGADLLHVCTWMAEYYVAPVGLVMRATAWQLLMAKVLTQLYRMRNCWAKLSASSTKNLPR